MAAESSTTTTTEEALKKIQDQVTCEICLQNCKQPKLLKCFHAFCEQCLRPLECAGKLRCPKCRKLRSLPEGGVQGLPGAFYINILLEIQDALKKSGLCPKHPEKEADFYCEECDQLLCSYCLLPVHRNHQYDLVSESVAKQQKVITDSLEQVKKRISTLEQAKSAVDTQSAAVIELKMVAVEEIRIAMAHLRQVLQARETELMGQVEQAAQQKLETLEALRDDFELQLGQLKSCQDFVEEKQRTSSQREILSMKSSLVKHMKDLTGGFKPETLARTEQAYKIIFTHRLARLKTLCQQFGEVDAYNVPLDSLRCELVLRDSMSRFTGTGTRCTTFYVYLNRPFTAVVLPNFSAPANIIGGLDRPWGIAVGKGGEIVVAELGRHCISVISSRGVKKSFGIRGSGLGQFNGPCGVAIHSRGNILSTDLNNHRIHQVVATEYNIEGTYGNGELQFQYPRGITLHPYSNKVYVADSDNHRIQVLNFDLTFCSSFGMYGSNNGELNFPYDVSTDREGNVYVADCGNHRIQVFTPSGVYLRKFGKEGEGEAELKHPVSIAIDSRNVVYIGEKGNNRVSIFSTNSHFITSFGIPGHQSGQFKGPYGLAVDINGTVYVCDTNNHRIQIFS